jgi:hypothetical protein
MTISNSPSIDLIEEFPSKELRLLEVKCKNASIYTHIKTKHVVTMN